MSGAFPDSATKEGVREVTFRLSPPRSRLGILGRRKRNSVSDDSDLFRLILLKSFEDDMARSLETGSSVGHMTLNEALVSDAIVIMVDATELAASDEQAPQGSRAAFRGTRVLFQLGADGQGGVSGFRENSTPSQRRSRLGARLFERRVPRLPHMPRRHCSGRAALDCTVRRA